MWSMKAARTTFLPASASNKRLPAAALALLLAGCVNDTASYIIEGREHNIMLHRVQDWFWQDTLSVTVAPTRMPECRGGTTIGDVPRRAALELYQAPLDYPEPIYILKVEDRHFAISTQSCRVQAFDTPPAELGTRLGAFEEVDGRLRFVPSGQAGGA